MTNDDNKTPSSDGRPSIDLAEVANVALERIAEQAITNPLRTLGIAAGVGYTLGRGLPTFVVRLGMVFGARIVTNALVSASLEQLGAKMRGEADEDEDIEAQEVTASNGGGKRRSNGRERRRSSTSSAPARD
jgi:hypothetical protein